MAKNAKKRHQQRMQKDKRNDGKFWAEGGRETILERYIPLYTTGLQKGWMEERYVLKMVRREYDYHVDWRLLDTEEPPQPFRLWTPTTEREPVVLSTPEEEAAYATYSEFMTKRIRRWLNYRARRLMKKYSKARGANLDDPFLVLLAKLTGVTKPKKALQAYQRWSQEQYDDSIKSTVIAEWTEYKEANGLPASKGVTAGFRGKVTMRLFKELPDGEQLRWAREAKAHSEAQRKEYANALKRPYAQDPESRQRAIDDFSKFITPILEGCSKILNFNMLLIAGGPIPEFGGELRTVTVPVGTNLDPIPSTFPEYKPDQFAAINEVYKAYLRSAYSSEDISSSALTRDGRVTLSDTQGLLPFDDEIRAIHEDGDISSDDSDSDDSSSDSDDDGSDDDPPPVVGKKRGRGKGSASEPPRKKRGGRKENSKNGRKGKSKVVERRERQTAIAEDGIEKSTNTSTETTAPVSFLPSTAYESLPLPFDITDPTIMNSIPSGDFSFAELHAPLVNGAIPDYMDPASWRMEDWTFDPSFGQVATASMDSSGTMGALDFGAVPVPAASTFPTESYSPATATLPVAPTFSAPTIPTADITMLAPVASAMTLALPPQDAPKVVGDGQEIDVSSAPAWFRALWDYLKNDNLGEEFMSVMADWYELEKIYNFANPRVGYAAKERPTILSAWIKCGRVRVANPSIADLSKFKAEFWPWWYGQQPEWRDVKMQMTPEGESWESARFPGVNGMCSFVALLHWWGEAARGQVEEMVDWKKAVDDVAWVMQSLRSEFSG